MIKDTWSEPGNPNQNPVEALWVKPLKEGTKTFMNQTGAPEGAWPWEQRNIADVHNHCSSPFLNYKTPISVRHGYIPAISAFLQFQFWEKVYFKVDNQAPNSKEAPGYWMGISHEVGDAMTYWIYSDKTKKVTQRSVVRSTDPNKRGTSNLRVKFETDISDHQEPETVDPENIMDDVAVLFIPQRLNLSPNTQTSIR